MADGRGGSRSIGYIIGAIILLLLLAWIFGLFGSNEVAEVGTGEEIVIEEGAATEEAVEDAAEDIEDALD